MRERGRVRQVLPNRIVIDVLEHTASSCNQCSLHGSCQIENGERTLTVWTKDHYTEGEEVVVEIRESVLIEIASLIFLLPTLLLIGGSALLARWVSPLWCTLGSFGIVGLYFCILRCVTPRIMRRFRVMKKESVSEVYDAISLTTRYPENLSV